MKKSLSYLPKAKRDELKEIVQTLLEFKEVEMVILFGSYATGKYVHQDKYVEDGITYVYKSDYDLLINLVHGITETLKQLKLFTPVSPIYEGAGFVNEKLSEGNYFFSDIKKEGVLLYDSRRKRLVRKRKLNIEEIKRQAQDYFNEWFESANGFLRTFQFNLSEKDYKIAAFQLHQATERYYHTVTLVFTDYKHKTHDLEELGQIASTLDLEFKKIFPRKTQTEKHHFTLLQRAYVDARYKKDYRITEKELEYLAKRVVKLRDLTEKVCKDKIKSFNV
jgi:HEPN domain-containing protein/predicted nucleotidyltransferase